MTYLSRRDALKRGGATAIAGAAAVAMFPAIATAPPDPALVAVNKHYAALKAFLAIPVETRADELTPAWKEAEKRFLTSGCEVFEIVPTTPAGMAHKAEFYVDWFDGSETPRDVMAEIAGFCKTLAEQPATGGMS